MGILFGSQGDLFGHLEAIKAEAVETVTKLSRNDLLSMEPRERAETLADHLIPTVPTLKRGDVKAPRHEEQGTHSVLILAVPFDGDYRLFEYKPSTYNIKPPQAEVSGSILELAIRMGDQMTAERIHASYFDVLDNVDQYLGWMRDQVDDFRSEFISAVTGALAQRRERIEKEQLVAEEVARRFRRDSTE